MASNTNTAELKAYEEAFGSGDAKQEPIPTSFNQAMEQTGLTDSFGMPVQIAPVTSTPSPSTPSTSTPSTTTSYNYKKLLVPALGVLALYLLFKKK